MKKKVTKEEQTQMNAKEFKKALEYIVKDNVVATIFTRRNDANIVDLLITYFDDKYVDFYRQNYYIHDLEITAELKRDIAFKVMKEYERSSHSTDEQIAFIINKVFKMRY